MNQEQTKQSLDLLVQACNSSSEPAACNDSGFQVLADDSGFNSSESVSAESFRV